MELYRLFIAFELPAPVRVALAEAQSLLRRANLPVRWSQPEQMHLTLQFLGDTDPAHIPELAAAMGRAAGMSAPLSLRLGGLGAFPNPRRPSVVWAGVAGDLPALEGLVGALAGELAGLGVERERRPFRAHLTLGRARREAVPPELERIGAALARLPGPTPVEWQAGQLVLFRSELAREGAHYTALAQAQLSGAIDSDQMIGD